MNSKLSTLGGRVQSAGGASPLGALTPYPKNLVLNLKPQTMNNKPSSLNDKQKMINQTIIKQ